ncbi:MAG: hypothetical protein ABR90_05465 [Cryomorphaceae bacterium BACL29 MAG-121220-bin8]|jgi:transforming growth factor-beta-induced protein|nr:MAG: hypothetical protein ABR90_05465 [Cryomorphaceae bacterium BACL29 MAG-121220-bin8]|tara:strand:+ start:25811 stop:26776 length:966 start_codon:yes stop_codon:yes gene_type:complete
MNKILKLLSVLILVFTLQSCSNDNDEDYGMLPRTIAEIVDSSMNYTFLSYALKQTNLVSVLNGTDKYTLMAPSNIAFRSFLMTNGYQNIDEVPLQVLKKILLNHVLGGELEYQNIESGYYKTAAPSEASVNTLSMYINQVNMRVKINGESVITQGNVRASNGIIHAVDRVIPLPSLVTFVTADTSLSNLTSALTRTDLTTDFVTALSTKLGVSPAPFTVFAPTDQAFINLLVELGVQNLSDINEPTLKATLSYHVISGTNALSTDLSDNLQLNTLGGVITANISGGATLTDGNNRISKIVGVDIQATNGVIHLIDKVILPN